MIWLQHYLQKNLQQQENIKINIKNYILQYWKNQNYLIPQLETCFQWLFQRQQYKINSKKKPQMKLQKILSWSFRWKMKNRGTHLWPQKSLQLSLNLSKPDMEELVLIMIYYWGINIWMGQYHQRIGMWKTFWINVQHNLTLDRKV